MALSIISLNVNGLHESSKREGLLQWLRSLPVTVDVVSLQETHCTSDVECHSWFSSSGLSSVLSPGTSRSGGCVILYRPALTLVNSWCEVPGRSLLCEFSFFDAVFRVLCLYAPNCNPARDLFFNCISDAVDPTITTVLCGDFNTVFDRSLDRFGSSADDVSRESTLALTRLFDSCCAVDIWRYLHPSSTAFTWNRWDGQLASRIDLIGSPTLGSRLCHPVTLYLSPPLTIAPCCFPSPFLMLSPLVLVYGSSMSPSFRMLHIVN